MSHSPDGILPAFQDIHAASALIRGWSSGALSGSQTRGGSLTYGRKSRCQLSGRISARLRSLEQAGVIERRPNRGGRGWEYHPTAAGRELETVLNDLGIWAQHWIELRREDCDPAYLMQTVHAILRPERLPAGPVTVRFEFDGEPKPYWLVIDGPKPELCYYDPGRDEDLVVRLDERVFGSVVLGRTRFADALHAGAIRLDGRPDLVRSFPTWLGGTRFAKYATPGVTPA